MSNTVVPQSPTAQPPGRGNVFDVQGFVRKYVPFSSRFLNNTKSGLGYDLVATFANANTPTAFTIALGQIPSRYVQQFSTVGGVVFSPSTAAWTPNSVTLEATVAGTYHVWVG